MQPFYGELFIEDRQRVNLGLFVWVGQNEFGETIIQLHKAKPPNGQATFLGKFGAFWTLRKVKRRLLVVEYEITFLTETPPVKATCVADPKFAAMLDKSIEVVNEQEL